MSWRPATLAATIYAMTLAGGALAGVVIPTQSLEKPLAVPVLSIKTIDGKNLSLTDFRGKVVLVNFWVTWCSPAARRFPGS
jgi:thiol-disulfide isomerase/thioredoxin